MPAASAPHSASRLPAPRRIPARPRGPPRTSFVRSRWGTCKKSSAAESRCWSEQRLAPHEELREWIAAVNRSFGLRGAAGAELRSVLSCAREARRRTTGLVRPQFGDLPLVVLTSRAWGEKWLTMHRELASRSRCGIHHVLDDRRHNIHMAHPDAVADAVTALLPPTSTPTNR